jgi:hypothetical protein
MMKNRHRVLYRQYDFPVFQNRMYPTAEEALVCPRGDIELVEDQVTGLVYNAAFRPELMVYDRDYQNEQAVSGAFRTHLAAVADIVERHLGSAHLVEIGCGKGWFLEMLVERGADVVGFDPTYEGQNPRIVPQYFAPGVGISARGMILRHVLEHIQDPHGFLHQLRLANGGGGLMYIEVPCLEWIIDRRAWFDVFYEHANYFRLSDFARMFGSVLHGERLFGGQYIGVVVDLATLRPPVVDVDDQVGFPSDFGAFAANALPDPQMPAVVWGGASKGVIFSLLLKRAGHAVQSVIDINPTKQGRYLPATGLRVQSPDEVLPTLRPGTTIFIMNSNYSQEIIAAAGPAFRYVEVDKLSTT